ncbi:MAG: helix-turn-helix domain-containing protein [Clostridia bacterium]|nr:helix-turn-helix domain-containing protein [Clostridia bacterium]
MTNAERKYVDWQKTAMNLKLLRQDNLNLRRYVCRTIRVEKEVCKGENCEKCKFEMDPSISRAELATVFNVTESVVFNWENGKSLPTLDDLLFYAQICDLPLFEVIILQG